MPPESAQHPLKYSYTFHVVRRKPKGKTHATNASWAENIEDLGSFGTVRHHPSNLHPLEMAQDSGLDGQTVVILVTVSPLVPPAPAPLAFGPKAWISAALHIDMFISVLFLVLLLLG